MELVYDPTNSAIVRYPISMKINVPGINEDAVTYERELIACHVRNE